jgi:hypothetical protein
LLQNHVSSFKLHEQTVKNIKEWFTICFTQSYARDRRLAVDAARPGLVGRTRATDLRLGDGCVLVVSIKAVKDVNGLGETSATTDCGL